MFRAILVLALLMFLTLMLDSFRNDHPLEDTSLTPLVVDIQGDTNIVGVRLMNGPCATVADILKAAGVPEKGIRRKGSAESLSRLVCSGRSVHIGYSESGDLLIRLESMPASARLTLGMKLDLNEASEEELCLAPLMKPEFASAIVNRRKNKPWEHLQDLMEISGIGPKTVEKWKDYLEVVGQER